MANLDQINFDPEFFDKYEKEILASYNKQTGKAIVRKKKKVLSFFNL